MNIELPLPWSVPPEAFSFNLLPNSLMVKTVMFAIRLPMSV